MWPRPPEMADLEEILMHHADRLIRGGNGHGDVFLARRPVPRDRALVGDLRRSPSRSAGPWLRCLPRRPSGKGSRTSSCAAPGSSSVIVAEPDRHSLWQERRTEILIGATLGSVLSAGLVFLIRHLVTRQAHTAEPRAGRSRAGLVSSNRGGTGRAGGHPTRPGPCRRTGCPCPTSAYRRCPGAPRAVLGQIPR